MIDKTNNYIFLNKQTWNELPLCTDIHTLHTNITSNRNEQDIQTSDAEIKLIKFLPAKINKKFQINANWISDQSENSCLFSVT